MSYIDGFVAAVPSAQREAFRAHVAAAAQVLRDHGALRVVECWGDDVPRGKVTDFYGAVQAKDEEVVVFSWIEYPSKAVRDASNAKMMTDPRMKSIMESGGTEPFDGKRMIFGGFAPIVDA